MTGRGAGIGVTLGYGHSAELIASFSLPTKTKDAQRTEMLGPTFGALICSTFTGRHFRVEGDSSYVMGLLGRQYLPNDMFLFNCLELIRDLLGAGKFIDPSWIPRANNSVCDALARQAVLTAEPALVIYSPLFQQFEDVWK